jgi:hypothetical protein
MNQKIQCLIDGGFISIEDVMEYTQALMYDYEPIWTEGPQRSIEPSYIVASTSHKEMMRETYVFQSDADGNITNLGEYGGIAERFGDFDWTNKDLAVERAMGEGLYELVRHISTDGLVTQSLYRRIYEPDDVQLPQDTSDGGQIQEP